MTLTGQGLIVLLSVVAVALPGIGVAAWSHVPGGHILAGTQRVAIVVICQLAALLLFGAVVNDYGYFYTSWHQLRGAAAQGLELHTYGDATPALAAHHTNPSTSRHIPSSLDPASSGAVQVLGHNGGDLAQWQQHGRLESVTVIGAVSGLKEHAFVYLPPQYYQPAYATTRFPAVEVMTGYPGDDVSLVRRLHYPDILQRAILAKQMQPTVLVMLRPAVTFPRDTECTDVPGGPQVLTFLAADVPAQTANAYRVQPTRWGVMGDSTGGYCATKIAMTHPLQFPAAVSLSGYFFALHDNTTGSLWGGSADARHTNDLFWRMQHLPPPPVSLLIATAKTEKGDDGYRQNVDFGRIVRAPTRATMLVESTGGHNFSTWIRELPPALHWLDSRIGAER